MGEMGVPMRITTDLQNMQENINRLQQMCRSNKVIMRNNGALAVGARKVSEMEAFLLTEMGKKSAEPFIEKV